MRPEKTAIVSEIRTQVDASPFVFLVDYKGLKVEQFSHLRDALRAAGAQVHVVKNRLFRVVARDRGWACLEPVLRRPSAMVVGRDPVDAARVLKKFRTDTGLLEAKAGMLGAALLSPRDMEALAMLPSREVLLAMMVGTVAAPMTRLVGVMHQKLASLVYVLKAVEQKKSA